MARIAGIRRLFRLPGRGAARIRADVDDELRFHIDQRAAEYVAQGMSPEAARAEATRAFGDLEYTRAYCRDQDVRGARAGRRSEWLGDLLHDARYAMRALRRAPGFALVAVLTLALGIGANAAIFSVVNRLLIHPLPFHDADRLAIAWRSDAKSQFLMPPTREMGLAWQQQARTLDGVELFDSDELTLAGEPEAEVVRALSVSPTYASFLGVRPLLGRGFVVEDTAAAAPDVVVLAEGLWKRRFGGSSEVLGKTVRLNGKPYIVVGVMPNDLTQAVALSRPPSIWVPLKVGSAPAPGKAISVALERVSVLTRLKPGVTTEQARAEMVDIASRAATDRKPSDSTMTVALTMSAQMVGGGLRNALKVLLGAVSFVLLIACANVANLLLARASAREREIAVRVALGAGRGRLVRQLLSESLVLALAGGAVGLLLASWGLDVIVGLRPANLDQLEGVRLDPFVLGFGALLSVLTGVLFGLVPALHATRPAVAQSLKVGASMHRNAVGWRRRVSLRSALVAAEVALSLVLLAGAGLLVRSVVALQRVDPGFSPTNLLSANISLPRPRYEAEAAYRAFHEQVLAGARRLPGVVDAVLASGVPPRQGIQFGEIEVEGADGAARKPAGDGPMIGSGWVGPEFFRILRIPLRAGRTFSAEEMAPGSKANVVVINEGMAKKYWPGESAVGKRLRVGGSGDWETVIGVVGDVKAFRGGEDPVGNRQAYRPSSTMRWPDRTLILRTRGDPAAAAPALKQLVRSLDPDLPLRDVLTVEAMMAESVAAPRFNMTLLSAFAGLALVLAAVGLYGVIAYSVSQRTREIGVRMALGARPGSVQRLVVAEGMRPALVGVALGVAMALGLGRALAGMLHDVSPRDPATLAGVSALLIVVALLACLLPARRAARVDPMVAIRAE